MATVACLNIRCAKAGKHVKSCVVYGFDYPNKKTNNITLKKFKKNWIKSEDCPQGQIYFLRDDFLIWKEPKYEFGWFRRLLDKLFGWHFIVWNKKYCLICHKKLI